MSATVSQLFKEGITAHERGELEGAEVCYRDILKQDPSHAEAMRLLGSVRLAQKDCGEAKRLLLDAARANPGSPLVHNDLGIACSELGEIEASLASFELAVQLDPSFHEAWNNAGNACLGLGRNSDSAAHFQKCLALDPGFAPALFGLAVATENLGKYEEAAALYRKAIAASPLYANSYLNLANLLFEQSQHAAARSVLMDSMANRGKSLEALCALAEVLIREGDFPGAGEALDAALDFKPRKKSFWFNYTFVLEGLGRRGEAIRAMENFASVAGPSLKRPQVADLQCIMGHMQLQSGNFLNGWELIENRWDMDSPFFVPRFPLARKWDGCRREGLTLLVVDEQGLGDTIQFSRYVPLLKKSDLRVIFQCQPELVRLFQNSGLCQQIVSRDVPAPEFDHYVPVMSLPGIFQTTSESVPAAIPYLFTTESNGRAKAGKPGGAPLKAGLAWKGNPDHFNDKHRSMTLDSFARLFDLDQVEFHSLQFGGDVLGSRNIRNDMVGVRDFLDTAECIEKMDLVISVDSSVAHLAGAMGKETWVLLPTPSEWRWLDAGESTPWYPTMRLFRQRQPGDWDGVLDEVETCLRERADTEQPQRGDTR